MIANRFRSNGRQRHRLAVGVSVSLGQSWRPAGAWPADLVRIAPPVLGATSFLTRCLG